MTEIKELDMNKYLVIKRDDLRYLSIDLQAAMAQIVANINYSRKLIDNKPQNKYLVLNLADPIDLNSLSNAIKTQSRVYRVDKMRAHDEGKSNIDEFIDGFSTPICKVSDIALALVNAILKAKGKE